MGIDNFVRWQSVETDVLSIYILVSGYKREELQVSLTKTQVKINGSVECEDDPIYYFVPGEFRLHLSVPEKYEIQSCESTLTNGVLVVTFKQKKDCKDLILRDIKIK